MLGSFRVLLGCAPLRRCDMADDATGSGNRALEAMTYTSALPKLPGVNQQSGSNQNTDGHRASIHTTLHKKLTVTGAMKLPLSHCLRSLLTWTASEVRTTLLSLQSEKGCRSGVDEGLDPKPCQKRPMSSAQGVVSLSPPVQNAPVPGWMLI